MGVGPAVALYGGKDPGRIREKDPPAIRTGRAGRYRAVSGRRGAVSLTGG